MSGKVLRKEKESQFLKTFSKAKKLLKREKQDHWELPHTEDPCAPLNSDDPHKPQPPYPYPGGNEEPHIDPLQHPPIVELKNTAAVI